MISSTSAPVTLILKAPNVTDLSSQRGNHRQYRGDRLEWETNLNSVRQEVHVLEREDDSASLTTATHTSLAP